MTCVGCVRVLEHCCSGLATLPSVGAVAPLVTPYNCRLGDLLCYCTLYLCTLLCVYACVICVIFVFLVFPLQLPPSVLCYCWLGLLTCKNRLPYNLYCVGGDVKRCSIQSLTTRRVWAVNVSIVDADLQESNNLLIAVALMDSYFSWTERCLFLNLFSRGLWTLTEKKFNGD